MLVLEEVRRMVRHWALEVLESKGLIGFPTENEENAKTSRSSSTIVDLRENPAQVVTFGSFRLKAHFKETDIDAVCIVPHYITQISFFEQLFKRFKADQRVSYCQDVSDA